jgi:hypothetical protein
MILDRSFASLPTKDDKNDTKKKMTAEDDIEDDTTMTTEVKDKIKFLWRRYGYLAIFTYLGIYATTLSSLFVALDFDIFKASTVGLDPNEAIKKVRIGSTDFASFVCFCVNMLPRF